MRPNGETIRYRMTVLDETETVAGVVTRVWEEYETENGELTEISRNFFAQTANGTVCYFGEDVDIYENGSVVAHDGAWRAGGDNQPGIFMLPDPKVNSIATSYRDIGTMLHLWVVVGVVLGILGCDVEGIAFVPDALHLYGDLFYVTNQVLDLNDPEDVSGVFEVAFPWNHTDSSAPEIVRVTPIEHTDLAGLSFDSRNSRLMVISDSETTIQPLMP